MLDIKKIYFPPKIQCKIIHCRNIQELHKHVNDIIQHFMDFGSPIMMGSDKDCSSKGILGISETENGSFLLILDPHFPDHLKSREKLQRNGWIKWKEIDKAVGSLVVRAPDSRPEGLGSMPVLSNTL
ncbi:ufm1-specific protease 1 [Trichonephila clavipes]|nr:ufm1-specific protease 1 [Trichonephila clavipes]